MKDVLEKVVTRKLGVSDPVIMHGASLLYETGEDLEEDMAAHYASLLDKVHKLTSILQICHFWMALQIWTLLSGKLGRDMSN